MLKHCCCSSVTSLTFKGQHRRDPLELLAWMLWGVLMQVLPSVWLCSSVLSPPQTVFTHYYAIHFLWPQSYVQRGCMCWAIRQVLDAGALWGVLYYGGL